MFNKILLVSLTVSLLGLTANVAIASAEPHIRHYNTDEEVDTLVIATLKRLFRKQDQQPAPTTHHDNRQHNEHGQK